MKKRAGYLAALAAMVFSFLMINSTSAFAWTAGGSWRNDTATGVKCATPQGNSTANGTVLTLWDCTGSWLQQFDYQAGAELVHRASGKCVTPRGNSSANGTVLTLWDCTGSNVQDWEIGDYREYTRHRSTHWTSGKCVTNQGNSQANGTYMTLWDCDSSWPRVQDWAMNWY